MHVSADKLTAPATPVPYEAMTEKGRSKRGTARQDGVCGKPDRLDNLCWTDLLGHCGMRHARAWAEQRARPVAIW